MQEWLSSAATAFALIFPVELPDKTFVATLILATRYRTLPVWLGVTSAFAVQCAIAATAGGLLGLLPARPVRLATAALFAAGAVVSFRGARKAGPETAETRSGFGERAAQSRRGWRAYIASFVVLFTAEWGDLSQLLTAGLVASGRPPIAVFAGSWLALATVSGMAVLLGRFLLARIRLAAVHYLASAVCAALAVITTVSALTD